MHKELTAKVQNITPKIPAETKVLSGAMIITPDDDLTLKRKGIIYAVYSLNSNHQYEAGLTHKIVNDVLHDSYFQSDNASPVQAIEKAILKLRDNLLTLIDSSATSATQTDFSIATTVLWGNTLYLVTYGNAEIFLMRKGAIKPVNSAKEGKFSIASGVVKDNDIIILATASFIAKYPPEKLIQVSSIPADDLGLDEASLMLKFIIKKELDEKDMLQIQSQEEDTASESLKNALGGDSLGSKMVQGIKTLLGKTGSLKTKGSRNLRSLENRAAIKMETPQIKDLDDRSEENSEPPQVESIMSLHELSSISKSASLDSQKETNPLELKESSKNSVGLSLSVNSNTLVDRVKQFKKKHVILTVSALVLILIVAGLISVYGSLQQAKQLQNNNTTGSMPDKSKESDEENDDLSEDKSQASEEEDAINKTIRVKQNVFYDLKIADESADPTSIILTKLDIIANDRENNRLFVSDINVPKFELISLSSVPAKILLPFDGDIALVDSEGLKTYDPATKSVDKNYENASLSKARAINTYLDFIYTVESSKIVKYTLEGTQFEPSDWTQSNELINSVSIGINFSIYVLTNNQEQGSVLKFTAGRQDEFSLTAPVITLKNPKQIVARPDLKYVYIADSGNNRIVIADDDGTVIAQLRLVDEEKWGDIRAIEVSSNDTKLYVLNETKIYEVNLNETLEGYIPQTQIEGPGSLPSPIE
ncbi:hypothetical protein H6802_01065 [Candidatus Nomurabacteria bacterium]|uniref:PPM-type phosphatase domain-containing protein n=1 Tax=candidate division WWE3 bacterium TaxID=2053526 RepID=A0A955E0P8_UNCKA|nr:hypothetical protein [candidate division WWE3 bacterium]MCB9823533.1 hypothetical protein [Candidatus Nomurabacteria bacterium]MCB9827328.1 hypothetical protein [Candidatus Nomurabacteria bacterium]